MLGFKRDHAACVVGTCDYGSRHTRTISQRCLLVESRLPQHNCPCKWAMAGTQEQALPVLHPVTDYEKIKRVGEGTYGVVCE